VLSQVRFQHGFYLFNVYLFINLLVQTPDATVSNEANKETLALADSNVHPQVLNENNDVGHDVEVSHASAAITSTTAAKRAASIVKLKSIVSNIKAKGQPAPTVDQM
jgi:hypothetical protein